MKPTSHIFIAFFILPLLPAITGCLPIEHTEVASPKIEGVVRQGGQPLANIEVHRVKGTPENACLDGETTHTDTAGRFQFEKLESREKTLLVIGDTFHFWRVGFALPSGACVDWSNGGGGQATEELECEVGQAPPAGVAHLPASKTSPRTAGCFQKTR